jgi:hypothetical protein
MNARQKNFILNKLIPFITREHGRGFGMSSWRWAGTPGEISAQDNVERKIPVCGTVACIGGSVQILKKSKAKDRGLAKILGLTTRQVKGLFYRWEPGCYTDEVTAWPEKFAVAFDKAITPYGKAMVAVRLLKEVVKTNGQCLETKE